MQFIVKLCFSLSVIVIATAIGKKFPSAGGLIAVMPLTGALVLVWIHLETQGDPVVMQAFSKSAVLGILPSVLFFFVAFICYRKGLSLPIVLFFSFSAWSASAIVHQWILSSMY